MFQIPYVSYNFPTYLGSNFQGYNHCGCSWADVVWAAVTVGRAERSHLLRHGRYSTFELVYRSSLIFANLMEGGHNFLQRSHAYNTLDPSKKGAISYFLGLTSAKLLAERYLDVPWLMRLDVYTSQLRPILGCSRSKPDLVGLTRRRDRIIMESKGRSGSLENGLITRAKAQTRQLRRIGDTYPTMRIALASFFENRAFTIRWDDPEDYDEQAEDINLDQADILDNYYHP